MFIASSAFVDFLDPKNDTFELEMDFNVFLAFFAFTVVQVAADGHCFLNCIRLFFRTWLPDVPDWTTDIVRDNFLEAMHNQTEFIDEGVDFESECDNYFDLRAYDSSVCDLVVTLRSKLFNIRIVLVDMATIGKLSINSTSFAPGDANHYPEHTIVVVRNSALHYELLVPIESAFMFQRQQSVDLRPPIGRQKRRPKAFLTEDWENRKRLSKNASLLARETVDEREARLALRREQAARSRKARQLANNGIGICYGDIDESLPQYNEHYLGRMDKACSSCGALHWEAERTSGADNFTQCCGKGKVLLEPYQAPPPALAQLFESREGKPRHPHYLNIMQNIVQYNNSYATASMLVDIFKLPGSFRQPGCILHNPTFTIHGMVNHRVSSVYPDGDTPPVFGQYFIMDTEQALLERTNSQFNKKCIPSVCVFEHFPVSKFNLYFYLLIFFRIKVFKTLSDMFEKTQCNPFMLCYKRMHELEAEYKAAAERTGIVYDPIVRMYIGRVKVGQHPGCYNPCRPGDIAAVFQTNDGVSPPKEFSVIVHSRDGTSKSYLGRKNPNIDPMCFPLMFPYGDRGKLKPHENLLR